MWVEYITLYLHKRLNPQHYETLVFQSGGQGGGHDCAKYFDNQKLVCLNPGGKIVQAQPLPRNARML